jgi:hypothetical protein
MVRGPSPWVAPTRSSRCATRARERSFVDADAEAGLGAEHRRPAAVAELEQRLAGILAQQVPAEAALAVRDVARRGGHQQVRRGSREDSPT